MAHVARASLLTPPPREFVRVVEAVPPFHSTSLEVFAPLRLEAAPDGSFHVRQTVKPKALPRAPETQGVRTRRNSGNQTVLEAVPEDRPLPEGSNAKEEPALAESKEGAVTKSKAVMPRRPILPDIQVPAFQPSASRPVRHHADTHRPLLVGFGSSLNLSNPREVTPSWCHTHGTTRSRYGLVGPGRKNYTPSVLLLSLPGPGEELVPYDSKEHQMAPSESATSHGSSS